MYRRGASSDLKEAPRLPLRVCHLREWTKHSLQVRYREPTSNVSYPNSPVDESHRKCFLMIEKKGQSRFVQMRYGVVRIW